MRFEVVFNDRFVIPLPIDSFVRYAENPRGAMMPWRAPANELKAFSIIIFHYRLPIG